MTLNKWIKLAREGANLTQDQLGERLDRTKAMVSHWENGKNEPSYSILLKIAQITNCIEPLPGLETFFKSADWPFDDVSKSEFDLLDYGSKSEVSNFIRWKISEEMKSRS